MSDDHSPGDRRQPYSDRGGPEGRHAETHDVEREKATNPKGPEPVDESFAEQLEPQTPESIREAQVGGLAASADKEVVKRFSDLSNAELASLSILDPDAPLEQGGTYLNLDDHSRRPFTAASGKRAGEIGRIVSKKTTDYELWNRLIHEDERDR
jgi:hypothetical protein